MKSHSPSKSAFLVVIGLLLAALSACDQGGGDDGAPPSETQLDPLTLSLIDPAASAAVRIDRIVALAADPGERAVHALLRAMRDRSQAAFLLVPDPASELKYRAVEFQKTGKDVTPLERVAAIVALEKIGTPVALPDLLLALDDRNEVVQNHAARALVRLGNTSGIPVLLANLENRVFPNETANRILEEISGEDMGFNPESGWSEKAKAIARWKSWWSGMSMSGAALPLQGRPYQQGVNPAADVRIAFFVDMLGQMQFLYHEQARTAMSRMGAAGLPFLRAGAERARKSGNATTRAGIAQVLAHVDHPNARQLLSDLLLEDDHATVKSRAAEALGAQGGPDAVRTLTKGLEDPDLSVTLASLASLGRIGGDDAVAAIRDYDASGDDVTMVARTVALFEATKGREGTDAVLGMLLATDIPTRNAAHLVLVRLTGEAADYDPLAAEKVRERAVQKYRTLLR